MFFGDKALPADERPPIPVVPELEDNKNWRAVYGEQDDVPKSYVVSTQWSMLRDYRALDVLALLDCMVCTAQQVVFGSFVPEPCIG